MKFSPHYFVIKRALSSSTRGTWIEISFQPPFGGRQKRRPPHGGRGLKCHVLCHGLELVRSSSTRGTWIEIPFDIGFMLYCPRRPPHGGRGLKCFHSVSPPSCGGCRPPHGGRGLKSAGYHDGTGTVSSSSTRGTWIEMSFAISIAVSSFCRPPHGGRGLKSLLRSPSFIAKRVVLHTGDVD